MMENGIVAPGVSYSGNLPASAVECTYDQYLKSSSYTLKDGVIVACDPPSLSLQTQAQIQLRTQQAYVMQTYTVYGDETPSNWISYLKALRAIASGTDTTSTALPVQPT